MRVKVSFYSHTPHFWWESPNSIYFCRGEPMCSPKGRHTGLPLRCDRKVWSFIAMWFYPSPKQLKLLLTLPQGEGDKQKSKKESVLWDSCEGKKAITKSYV